SDQGHQERFRAGRWLVVEGAYVGVQGRIHAHSRAKDSRKSKTKMPATLTPTAAFTARPRPGAPPLVAKPKCQLESAMMTPNRKLLNRPWNTSPSPKSPLVTPL